MRINEVILESYQTDEGVLGTIGRGVAAGLGGLAKGAGMISGVGQGMKQAYQKGKATSAAHIAGDVPKAPKPVSGPGNPTYDKEYARLTQPQAALAAAPNADASSIQAQIAQKQKELADLQAQLKSAEKAPAAQADTRIEPKLEPEAPAAKAPAADAASRSSAALAARQSNVGQDSDAEIKDAMANLQSAGKGPGDPMFDLYKSELDKRASAAKTPAAQTPPAGGTTPNFNQGGGTAMPMKPYQVPGAVTPTIKQPNLQVQQGGASKKEPNPDLAARRAAVDKSKADRAAGKGITGAIKTGTLGEDLDEGFYSKFLGHKI